MVISTVSITLTVVDTVVSVASLAGVVQIDTGVGHDAVQLKLTEVGLDEWAGLVKISTVSVTVEMAETVTMIVEAGAHVRSILWIEKWSANPSRFHWSF